MDVRSQVSMIISYIECMTHLQRRIDFCSTTIIFLVSRYYEVPIFMSQIVHVGCHSWIAYGICYSRIVYIRCHGWIVYIRCHSWIVYEQINMKQKKHSFTLHRQRIHFNSILVIFDVQSINRSLTYIESCLFSSVNILNFNDLPLL